ncbi:hypothetical protein [Ideonella livida]|uniref:Uncharacterized protein n=1 Tax=Ideonella livida TaxID=2707176 RepID=A0A7C9TIU2_9BURK|nr:hypothetical protein [Ideonella livida]NDY89747.1 hypothetical protein [Ideonella livida]
MNAKARIESVRTKLLEQSPDDELVPDSKRLEVVGVMAASLARARAGCAAVEDWRVLADLVQHIRTMEQAGNLQRAETDEHMTRAFRCLALASESCRTGGGLTFDSCGLEALEDLLAVYDQSLAFLSQREALEIGFATAARVARESASLDDTSSAL